MAEEYGSPVRWKPHRADDPGGCRSPRRPNSAQKSPRCCCSLIHPLAARRKGRMNFAPASVLAIYAKDPVNHAVPGVRTGVQLIPKCRIISGSSAFRCEPCEILPPLRTKPAFQFAIIKLDFEIFAATVGKLIVISRKAVSAGRLQQEVIVPVVSKVQPVSCSLRGGCRPVGMAVNRGMIPEQGAQRPR